ncbi:hypothetical protein [Streptomyces cinereoruber]|uniref:hypothetical protein n=1 Tax=Streptomyces cinereoruber TaxID=67260 RepID=UPI00364586AA
MNQWLTRNIACWKADGSPGSWYDSLRINATSDTAPALASYNRSTASTAAEGCLTAL